MSKPLVYLLGPMTGYFNDNRDAFREWTRKLRASGYDVISPDELDNLAPAEVPDWGGFLVRDIPFLLQAQAGAALPGWRNSPGATLEATILTALGRPIYEIPTMERVPDNSLPRPQHPV